MQDYESAAVGGGQAKPHPPVVYCYICGRQFGSASIAIHQPQCLKKWQAQNALLPKEQRRPEPQPPKIVRQGDGSIDFEATNQAAYEASLAQLVPCANCGRKFSPERLAIHQHGCTRDHPAKSVAQEIADGHRPPRLAVSTAVEKHKRRGRSEGRGWID